MILIDVLFILLCSLHNQQSHCCCQSESDVSARKYTVVGYSVWCMYHIYVLMHLKTHKQAKLRQSHIESATAVTLTGINKQSVLSEDC